MQHETQTNQRLHYNNSLCTLIYTTRRNNNTSFVKLSVSLYFQIELQLRRSFISEHIGPYIFTLLKILLIRDILSGLHIFLAKVKTHWLVEAGHYKLY